MGALSWHPLVASLESVAGGQRLELLARGPVGFFVQKLEKNLNFFILIVFEKKVGNFSEIGKFRNQFKFFVDVHLVCVRESVH